MRNKHFKNPILKRMWEFKSFYIMLIPSIVFILVFKYIPIYGIQLAFRKFSLRGGIMGSPWVGLDNFAYLMLEEGFWLAFRNTLIIAVMKLVIYFPFPVILSLLINEVRGSKFKRTLQTIYTFPHFLSWVVISGIAFTLFNSGGAINGLLTNLGFENVNIMTQKSTFRLYLVFTTMWKEAGWSTIIYLAAIAGIDPTLYEAAKIDGANRFQSMVHITWPGIRNIVLIMFVMRIGHSMDAGFMQILNLYNPAVYEVSDIIDTYVYRMTFKQGLEFGQGTAVSLFKGVINLVLLLSANYVAKKTNGQSLF